MTTFKDLEKKFGISDRTCRRWIKILKTKGFNLDTELREAQYHCKEETLKIMEALNTHMKMGAKIEVFEYLPESEVTAIDERAALKVDLSSINIPPSYDLELFAKAIATAMQQVMAQVNPRLTPVEKRDALLYCAIKGLLLSSKDIQFYCGANPYINSEEGCYQRGNFCFFKHGKIGRGTAWRVEFRPVVVN